MILILLAAFWRHTTAPWWQYVKRYEIPRSRIIHDIPPAGLIVAALISYKFAARIWQ